MEANRAKRTLSVEGIPSQPYGAGLAMALNVLLQFIQSTSQLTNGEKLSYQVCQLTELPPKFIVQEVRHAHTEHK